MTYFLCKPLNIDLFVMWTTLDLPTTFRRSVVPCPNFIIGLGTHCIREFGPEYPHIFFTSATPANINSRSNRYLSLRS
jgi:hypothetical protein